MTSDNPSGLAESGEPARFVWSVALEKADRR